MSIEYKGQWIPTEEWREEHFYPDGTWDRLKSHIDSWFEKHGIDPTKNSVHIEDHVICISYHKKLSEADIESKKKLIDYYLEDPVKKLEAEYERIGKLLGKA